MLTFARSKVVVHGRRVGIFALALTLMVLTVVVIIGSFATSRAAGRTERAVLLNTAYQKAATGVAAEESLERTYQLQPRPLLRADYQAAQKQVGQALDQVRLLGDSGDRRFVAMVRGEHATYLRAAGEVFDAVDRQESAATIIAIRALQVDPVFLPLQAQVALATSSHQLVAVQQATRMRITDRLVLALDIATLLAAMMLIAVAGVALTRSQRRLQSQSDLNRHQALHDSLTGLPNRALFQDRTAHALEAAQRSGGQVAVMLVDLNRFKDVNDTLGHHYGDLLLWQVAKRFSAATRAPATPWPGSAATSSRCF